jgi:hypothetical protein
VEYEGLVDRAVFQPGDRVELVGGQLIVREPQGSPHAVAVRLATVCAGSPRDYLAGHPSRPVLLVEVADASLAFDREHKGSLYARARPLIQERAR